MRKFKRHYTLSHVERGLGLTLSLNGYEAPANLSLNVNVLITLHSGSLNVIKLFFGTPWEPAITWGHWLASTLIHEFYHQ